jgi:hypothetical protein
MKTLSEWRKEWFSDEKWSVRRRWLAPGYEIPFRVKTSPKDIPCALIPLDPKSVNILVKKLAREVRCEIDCGDDEMNLSRDTAIRILRFLCGELPAIKGKK